MADYRIKTLSWLAPVAMVGALGLAACGDEDASESTRTVSPAALANGSDRHLENLAADAERRTDVAGSDVHLANQAAEIAERPGAAGSDVHLANQAAEVAEREAHLDNAAETYANADEPEPSNDEFVPGTRRMPAR